MAWGSYLGGSLGCSWGTFSGQGVEHRLSNPRGCASRAASENHLARSFVSSSRAPNRLANSTTISGSSPPWRRSGPSSRCKFVYHTGETWRPKSRAASTKAGTTPAPCRSHLKLHGQVGHDHPRSKANFSDQFGAYTAARSKHTSLVPSPSTPWKRISGCFVFWDLHRGA